jgi:hypothetical protein
MAQHFRLDCHRHDILIMPHKRCDFLHVDLHRLRGYTAATADNFDFAMADNVLEIFAIHHVCRFYGKNDVHKSRYQLGITVVKRTIQNPVLLEIK